MNKETMLADFEQTNQKLLDLLSQFNQNNFNEKSSPDEWSAAEIAEHLLKVETYANKAVRGESSPANRAANERVKYLEERMKDTNKRVASERVAPSAGTKDISLITQLQEQGDLMKEAIQTLDETEDCTGLPHPVLGTMTRMEWVYFIIHHTERHLRQLKRLEEKIVS